jgi:putative ABC transport system substrate-binding protein
MIRKFLGSLLVTVLLATVFPVEAQQPKKMARIGYLSPQSRPPPTLEAFKQGLAKLGWVEGKQVEFEYRYAGSQLDKLSDFAAELVRLKVDIIVTVGNRPPLEAKRATTTIPILMVGVVEPVSAGLVASLARPGSNVTGLTLDVTREQAGKNLELLKEAIPKLSRVAILRNPAISDNIAYSVEAERAAKILGVTIQFAETRATNHKELVGALDGVIKQRANALLVTPYGFFSDRRQEIIDFAARHKLPAIYFRSAFVTDGGLMSYGASGRDMWRRAAIYVDKILKGTKPADLPVEQPMKFEFVINLKNAKQIGLTIPQWTLMKADWVIR